jgi:hypothetical protein
MAALAYADIIAILKERYPSGLPLDVFYKTAPFLAMIPKDEDLAFGENIKVPILYSNPQSVGADFAIAQALAEGTSQAAFKVTTKNYYGFGAITGEAIKKGSRDKGSFLNTLETQINGAMTTVKRSLLRYLFGNGGGALGQISAASNVGTPTITLANPTDVVYFEKGMVIRLATTDGTSGALETGSVTLTKVDRNTGNLTASGNWTAGIATAAVNMYLFRSGDFGAVQSGFRSWVPDSAPSATTFFGVDRTVDTRLGGCRGDFSAIPIREGVQRALKLLHVEESEADFGVMNSEDWLNFSLALQAGGVLQTTTITNQYGVGIEAIKVGGPGGVCKVISDPGAPKGRLLAGQLDTWKWCTMGAPVDFLDDDGLPYLRQAAADAVEIRVVNRGNLVCYAPGKNGNFLISSVT